LEIFANQLEVVPNWECGISTLLCNG